VPITSQRLFNCTLYFLLLSLLSVVSSILLLFVLLLVCFCMRTFWLPLCCEWTFARNSHRCLSSLRSRYSRILQSPPYAIQYVSVRWRRSVDGVPVCRRGQSNRRLCRGQRRHWYHSGGGGGGDGAIESYLIGRRLATTSVHRNHRWSAIVSIDSSEALTRTVGAVQWCRATLLNQATLQISRLILAVFSIPISWY